MLKLKPLVGSLVVSLFILTSGFNHKSEKTITHHDSIGHSVLAEVPTISDVGMPNLNSLKLNPKVDMRNVSPPIYNQQRTNSCTAFASVKGILEIERRAAGLPAPEMSAAYQYYNERIMEGTTEKDTGSHMRMAAYVMMVKGALPEESMPFTEDNITKEPSYAQNKEADDYRVKEIHSLHGVDDIITSLDNGHPVMLGIPVWQSLGSFRTVVFGVVQMPSMEEMIGRPLGGHAICIVGYDPISKYFIVRNSWGAKFGDKGYLYIPFDYIKYFGGDEWSVEIFN